MKAIKHAYLTSRISRERHAEQKEGVDTVNRERENGKKRE